jgi:hypothetical protein
MKDHDIFKKALGFEKSRKFLKSKNSREKVYFTEYRTVTNIEQW